MTHFNAKLAEVVRKDSRYAYEAYEFIFQALHHTQQLLGRMPPGDKEEQEPDKPPEPVQENAQEIAQPRHHVSGRELLEGVRSLALREFGLMAPTVFAMWGIRKTDDFGEIVFNLVEAELMSKTEEATRADFHDLFDLNQALVEGYRIQVEETR